jgi:hypothetical protein
MTASKRQQWRLRPGEAELDEVLTEFVARRIMKVTRQRPGELEVKGGSALAAGKRARALDWLPVRARIAYAPDGGGYVVVDAEIGPRGRPHLRRALFDELYEHKLSSWLAELDRTLRARTDVVEGVPAPKPTHTPRHAA